MKFGILSDIHEDLDSLRIALDIFSERKCDELVCLGDILGYDSNFYQKIKNRNASECISIVQNYFKYVVIGNHDLYAIKKIPQQLNGFIYPEHWYDLDIEQRRTLSNRKIWLYENEELNIPLTSSEMVYLDSLPEYIITESSDLRIHFSHSIFPDLTGSNFFRLHNLWELRSHFEYMKSGKLSVGFSGHMHSNKLIVTTRNKIKQLPYNKSFIEDEPTQFLCPCIANGKGKCGLIIADTNKKEIEAIEINNKFKIKLFSMYGKSKKK
jgi:predicted phosphodiesterase